METVSLISVLYNHPLSMIHDMVTSIHTYMQYCPYFEYDIILVDNSEIKLDIDLDGVQLLESSENLGYCGGNNLGISTSRSDYIIVINPDIIIKDSLVFDWLIGTSKFYNAISGTSVGFSNTYTYAASFPTDKQYLNGELPFVYDSPTHNLPGDWRIFPYIDGSLMCFTKALWNDVGWFDDKIFPGYFGENAFEFQAYLKGYLLKECNIRQFYDHNTGHNNQYIPKWTQHSRQYFYDNYAIPNWNRFLQYLRKI